LTTDHTLPFGYAHSIYGITNLPLSYPSSTLDLQPNGSFGHGFGTDGEDRPLLARIFRNLPSLRTIQLRDWLGPTDATASDSDKLHLIRAGSRSKDDDIFNDHMFAVTLAALADAKARPRILEVLYSGASYCLHDYAFHIPPDLQPSLAPVLSGLKKLDLTLALASHEELEALPNSAACLQKFLSLTTNLEDLRLRFYNGRIPDSADDVLSWLGRDPETMDNNNNPHVAEPCPFPGAPATTSGYVFYRSEDRAQPRHQVQCLAPRPPSGPVNARRRGQRGDGPREHLETVSRVHRPEARLGVVRVEYQ
jgi:hypothetical protein